MTVTRRSFLLGAGSGVTMLTLVACTDDTPVRPSATPSASQSGAVPVPAGMLRSDWGTDALARGSSSYLPVGVSPEQREVLRRPIGDRVFFAGEATSDEHPGTVLGARESGVRVALEVGAAASVGDRIAVIGAGAAGAAAARRLADQGWDVIVVEARDRVGGRIHSIDDPQWPVSPELGAAFLRAEADLDVLDALRDRADEADTTEIPSGSLTRTPDSVDLEDGTLAADAVVDATTWAQEQLADVSLERALTDSGVRDAVVGQEEGAARLAQYLAAEVSAVYGAAAAQLSAWAGVDRVAGPQRLVSGFDSLIAADLDGLDVFLSTAVTGITSDDDGVSLRLGTGESLAVDRLVVTVPLGVLQNDGIEFAPLLPTTQRGAIAALGSGTVDVIWLRFDEPFWQTDAAVWNLVGSDEDLVRWINLGAITGDPVLVGVVGGDAAARIAELSDDELLAEAMAALEPFSAG